MNRNKKLFVIFVLVALIQLFVPAKMIFDKEYVLAKGTEYKFKTAPIDPYDPFKGKYITLSYETNRIKVEKETNWKKGDVVYALLTTDEEGFVIIESILKSKPIENQNFLKTKIRYINRNSPQDELILDFPFDRFYMEESKAYNAELSYRDSQSDSNKTTYALVNIKDGDAVLKDVLINGVPIKIIAEEWGERNE